MKKQKSKWRLYAENLVVIVTLLMAVSLLVTVVAGLFFGLDFAHARVVGGRAAIAYMLVLLVYLPQRISSEEQKRQKAESQHQKSCKSLDDKEKQLQKANLFIAEFVGLQVILERMRVLRDDYHKRVSRAQVVLREQVSTEPDSVSKLDGALEAITEARFEVVYAEQAYNKARILAAEQGFAVSPLEQHSGLAPVPEDKPDADAEVRNRPVL